MLSEACCRNVASSAFAFACGAVVVVVVVGWCACSMVVVVEEVEVEILATEMGMPRREQAKMAFVRGMYCALRLPVRETRRMRAFRMPVFDEGGLLLSIVVEVDEVEVFVAEREVRRRFV